MDCLPALHKNMFMIGDSFFETKSFNPRSNDLFDPITHFSDDHHLMTGTKARILKLLVIFECPSKMVYKTHMVQKGLKLYKMVIFAHQKQKLPIKIINMTGSTSNLVASSLILMTSEEDHEIHVMESGPLISVLLCEVFSS